MSDSFPYSVFASVRLWPGSLDLRGKGIVAEKEFAKKALHLAALHRQKSMKCLKTFGILAVIASVFQAADLSPVFAQGTIFMYQGRLQEQGRPATGSYEFQFRLHDSLENPNGLIAGPVTTSLTAVDNGIFTIPIDFGPSAFTGGMRFLEIAVRTNGLANFTTLAPRQPILPAPYAITAGSAGSLRGTLPASQLTGSIPFAQLPDSLLTNNGSGVLRGVFSGDGSGLTNITAAKLAGTIGTLAAGTITLENNLRLPASTAQAGVIYLGGETFLHSYGLDNFFGGRGAGNFSMTGSANTATGRNALRGNTAGNDNTADGYLALQSNTLGSQNTAVGREALRANTSGVHNTASGFQSLSSNTTGSYNAAAGYQALFQNVTGSLNTADGDWSLRDNTTGIQNTASGNHALLLNTTGSQNSAVGVDSLASVATGTNNVALGFKAGFNLTAGDNNILIGNAGAAHESGVIRIGTPGVHTSAFVAGLIKGDGGGLTNVPADAISGGLTVNVSVLVPGGGTKTLVFINGILRRIE